jgi:hypothetical protein
LRRFLYFLGGAALVVLLVAGIGIGVVAYKGHGLDAESKTFVDSAVPAISSNWSQEQLLDRATPELRKNVNPNQLTVLFQALSRLGPLVKYEGSTGAALMSYMTGSGGTVSATYVAKAKFQNGGAVFRIVLSKRGERWMIQNFHVDPRPTGRVGQGT